MSGRDNRSGGGNNQSLMKSMEKLKDTFTRKADEQAYQRVDTVGDTLSQSNTATSLDTILPEPDATLFPPQHIGGGFHQLQRQQHFQSSDEQPIQFREPPPSPPPQLDTLSTRITVQDITPLPLPPPPSVQHSNRDPKQRSIVNLATEEQNRSRSSLKGSRVSFEKKSFGGNKAAAGADDSSDEDNFETRRTGFQQQKTVSVDNKGILKDLKNILANDNRHQFQAKKQVSLDINGTRRLKDLLKEDSSEEEFQKNRRDFQGRKHQSLDPRVSFKLERVLSLDSTDSDEEGDDNGEQKRLIHRPKDITKPVIIDLKDLESESDEDYITKRQSFQKQKTISTDSRKSTRYEMDDMGRRKSENIRNAVPFVRQITEDGKPKLEVYRPTTNPIYIWSQVLAALSVSLGSLVVGFSAGYSSPATDSMKNPNVTDFVVTKQEASWVGGIMPLTGLLGGLCGGPFIEYFGRRNTILAIAVPFIVSWLLIACAVNIAMVLAGRALTGFCVGVTSLSLPVYLGEIIQPEVRGTLGLLPPVFGNIGILLVFVAGSFMNWSILAFLGASLPVPFLILMFLIPESPPYYVQKNREEQARKALVWLRGKKADVEPELKGLMRSKADNDRQAKQNALRELLKRNHLKPLSISLGLMFFQQLSGINAVIFYTVAIFKDAGSTIDSNICTIIVGAVNFLAVFIATILIDRLGRKMLLYISDAAMILTLFTLGGFFYCKNTGMDVSNVGWLPLASFVIYVLGFSMGFGPIPWLMMGEILPVKIRGTAASVATAFNWLCTFVVTKTFQDMLDTMGAHGAFWLFGCVCIVALFFVIFYVPETQGKSLEEIERKMMGHVRRMSSVANIKPLSFNM